MPSRPRTPSARVRPRAPFPLPYTTVDVVLFTIREGALHALLARRPRTPGEPYPGLWALPGGFVDIDRDEDLLACARRKLSEKTGVRTAYLEQLGGWGGRRRDPRGWSSTHVYFALVASGGLELRSGGNAEEVAWFPLGEGAQRGRLAFDHAAILAAAIERLRAKVEYTSLPAFLLAEPFTLPQLQRAYEIILDRALDKSSFRTRMLDAGFLAEAGSVEGEGNRPAMGYRIRDRDAPVIFPRTFRAREDAPQ